MINKLSLQEYKDRFSIYSQLILDRLDNLLTTKEHYRICRLTYLKNLLQITIDIYQKELENTYNRQFKFIKQDYGKYSNQFKIAKVEYRGYLVQIEAVVNKYYSLLDNSCHNQNNYLIKTNNKHNIYGLNYKNLFEIIKLGLFVDDLFNLSYGLVEYDSQISDNIKNNNPKIVNKNKQYDIMWAKDKRQKFLDKIKPVSQFDASSEIAFCFNHAIFNLLQNKEDIFEVLVSPKDYLKELQTIEK